MVVASRQSLQAVQHTLKLRLLLLPSSVAIIFTRAEMPPLLAKRAILTYLKE